MTEFEIIQRFFARSARNGDDAALLTTREGYTLVTSIDTLVAGCHFPLNTSPADIGYKSLAVSLSDMAAMGAEPTAALLSLTLPSADATWLTGFSEGLFELADQYAVELIGGDTTRGPLAISTVLFGLVPTGKALLRSGANVNDDIYVSGVLGSAAAALRYPVLNQTPLNRPSPRIKLGIALRDTATSCLDISDGLLQDLGHILKASHVGAHVTIEDVPIDPTLKTYIIPDHLHLSGGDDYELCFTAPEQVRTRLATLSQSLALPLTRIGKIVAGNDLNVTLLGYQHF